MKRRKQTQADQEAADWIVRLHALDASAEDHAEHEEWLRERPENEHAYRVQQQIWDQVPAVGELDHYPDLVRAPFLERWMFKLSLAGEAIGDTIRRPQFIGGFAALLIAAIATTAFLIDRPVSDPAPITIAEPVEHVTQVAEIREQVLPDGSVVTLGAKSRINVVFSEQERRVTLLAGEAFFDVETDPTRPFFVEARDSVTRVVGTQFDVRLREDAVTVAVAEGEVEVLRVIKDLVAEVEDVIEPAASLTAGQAVVLPTIEPAALTPTDDIPIEPIETALVVTEIETDDVAAWRVGRLVFDDVTLSEVVSDLNRYYPGEIILGDDEVGELAVFVTLRSDEIDRALSAIDANMPVDIARRANGRVILTKDN